MSDSESQPRRRRNKEPEDRRQRHLLGRGDNLENIIRENSEDLIQAIEHQIQRKDEEGFSEYTHPLPNDFERDGGGDSDAVRDIVWGQVIEFFKEHIDNFQVTLRDGAEGTLICLRWHRAINLKTIEHFRRVVSMHYEVRPSSPSREQSPPPQQSSPYHPQGDDAREDATHVSLGWPSDRPTESISSRYRTSMPVGFAGEGGGTNFGH